MSVCVCVCVCSAMSIYLSILDYLSSYLAIYHLYVSIYMFFDLAVPEVPVLESAMCVCVCVCVSFNYFALVLSLCCWTGVGCGAVGSESTMYTVNVIHCNGDIGG